MTRPAPQLRARRLAAAACLATAACSGSEGGGDGRRSTSDGAIARPSGPPIVEALRGGYRGGPVAAVGSVRGTIAAPTGDSAGRGRAAPGDGATSPRDSAAAADRACAGAKVPELGLDAVIVWIADARVGKKMPLERRFRLTNEKCQVEPPVTAAVTGGALNVLSEDRTTHQLRFTRVGTGEVEATMTQVDEGSLVANDKLLARPGLFEVSCAVHPFERAWVAAFDHPYFAIASAKGAFALDSVPPGTYTVRAWHERWGTAEGSVTVAAGQPAEVALTFRGGAGATGP